MWTPGENRPCVGPIPRDRCDRRHIEDRSWGVRGPAGENAGRNRSGHPSGRTGGPVHDIRACQADVMQQMVGERRERPPLPRTLRSRVEPFGGSNDQPQGPPAREPSPVGTARSRGHVHLLRLVLWWSPRPDAGSTVVLVNARRLAATRHRGVTREASSPSKPRATVSIRSSSFQSFQAPAMSDIRLSQFFSRARLRDCGRGRRQRPACRGSLGVGLGFDGESPA